MPILDSKSEAFLALFKGLQKGKGKEGEPAVNSQTSSQQTFTADDWKTPTTVSKDFAPASEPPAEPAANGQPNSIETPAAGPTDPEPESEEKTTDAFIHEIGAESPALAEYAAAYGHSSTNDPTAANSPVVQPQAEDKVNKGTTHSSLQATAGADPPANDDANNYAAASSDLNTSELGITTHSMTTSGAATNQAETSAAMEKPASSHRPSPSPATPEVSTPRAEAWPPGLLSSGSEFLKALPKAADAFKPRMRGGKEKVEFEAEDEEDATPITATSVNDDVAANANRWFGEVEEKPQSSFPAYPAIPNPENHSDPIQSPQSTRINPWAIKAATSSNVAQPQLDSSSPWASKAFTTAEGELQTDSSQAWGIKKDVTIRYTEAMLRRIGMEAKWGLFEKLLETEGKGRVKVGIVKE